MNVMSVMFVMQIQLSADFPGLALVWLFAFGIFGISLLGIVAACCEKPVVLKLVRPTTPHQA